MDHQIKNKPGRYSEVLPDLFLCKDACNVYVLKRGDEAIAIDFGSGRWVDALPEIGVRHLRHVLLTHAHRDQCYGLSARANWPFEVHCSGEDARYFQADRLGAFWRTVQAGGCPGNYAAPREPLPFVRGDLGDAAELHWGDVTVGVAPTPGPTRGALTYVVDWDGKGAAFCGDAAHDGGTLHQPFHLEWDHWTAEGALAAWHGLERLGACRLDVLCPSHGPVVGAKARACMRQVQRRVMAFVKAKGSVCAGERDRWFPVERLNAGLVRVVPDLYHFGGNSYLLVGDGGEGLVIDPTLPSIEGLAEVLRATGVTRVTAATATHYHRDHCDGLNCARETFGASVWLHPWVAAPIANRDQMDMPWLPAASIAADRILPVHGRFQWNRYSFGIRPFPGQTWWHCAFDAEVFGRRVLFSGDNFQPPTRWNGTGGFCAYNGCRFSEGFARSAQVALDLKPDVICNGHGCIYRFHAGHYRRILKWAEQAEDAVRALCPHGWGDYDPRAMSWVPYRSSMAAGDGAASMAFHVANAGPETMQVAVYPRLPEGWTALPEVGHMRVPAENRQAVVFEIRARAAVGRYVIGADVEVNGGLVGEAAVALVDVA